MKKFTKLFLSCTAMAVVTAAVASSAMAAGEVTATYDEKSSTAIIEANYDVGTNGQRTLLILAPGKQLHDLTSATSEELNSMVKAIEQDSEITSVALPADLESGKYVVYMGGDGNVYDTTMQVGEVVGGEVLIGDADQDGFVDASDSTAILKYNIDQYVFVDNGEAAADADQDGFVDASDSTAILKYNIDIIDSSNSSVGSKK